MCEVIEIGNENKYCPFCNEQIGNENLSWCYNCKKWIELIDYLSPEERQNADQDCLKCWWLKQTKFYKNNQPIFYCNCAGTGKPTELINDFRKCKKHNTKGPGVEK